VQELNNPDPLENAGVSAAKWTGTVSEVVELLVSIQECGMVEIDNQPATLIQRKDRFKLFTDIDIKNINDTDYANRQKKKQSTRFLTKLITKNIERANRLLGSS
jgi:hypothetical protein